MLSSTRLYFLLTLCIIKMILPETTMAFSSWQIINKSGYRIYYTGTDMEYALNLLSDIEIIFNKTTELAGYEPSIPLNIYLTEKIFKKKFSVLAKNIFDSNRMILFVDDDYSRSIIRIWNFTVKEVLDGLNTKASGFSVLKHGSMESWLPGTLSVYLREGLPGRDKMILKSMLLNDTALSLKPSLHNNYSKDERRAVYRGFIFFITKSYGDAVLTAALRNISYYGGFVKALESITGHTVENIEIRFNKFYNINNPDINKKEVLFPDNLEFFDNDNLLLMAADEKGKILYFDKLHKSLEFLEINNNSDPGLSDFNNYKKISSIPFDFSEESIQGSFLDNKRAVISVLEEKGTTFYFVDYREKTIEKEFFIPYIYIRELSGNHLPESLIFSAVEGIRKDVFIFHTDSMSVERITESRGEYSYPAVYNKDNIIFLDKSDKSRIYKYDFSDNKTVLEWESGSDIKDLTVSESGKIFFSMDINDVFNVFRYDSVDKTAVQLTYFTTGAFSPLVYSNNKLIISCYIERKFKNALLNQ